MTKADFVVVGEDNGGIGIFLVGFDDFCGVGFVVGVVLMGDGDERSGGRMDGEIEITADIGVGAFDNLKMVFGGESFDVLIGGGGGN